MLYFNIFIVMVVTMNDKISSQICTYSVHMYMSVHCEYMYMDIIPCQIACGLLCSLKLL